MTFTEDVTVEHDGKRYTLTAAELQQRASYEPAWQSSPGRPSSGLVDAVFARARENGAPEAAAYELTARALGISVDKVRSALEWESSYRRMHDGDVNEK